MRGQGKQRIQLADKKKQKTKKRHNQFSDGGTRNCHLVFKIKNEESAPTN